MADTVLKSKIQIRSTSINSNGSLNGGDKTPITPITPSKLMINHGKPNFTIPRSTAKAQQNDGNDVDVDADVDADAGAEQPPINANNNNYNAFKTADLLHYSNNTVSSTKFSGTFSSKHVHQSSDSNDNEATRVVLRRARTPETSTLKNNNDNNDEDSVPEFIRRQRRIQERLAKENVLDFENRRSGYFTHVVISPTSPNRQSFGATMSSPPVVRSLETSELVVSSPKETMKSEEISIESGLTNGDNRNGISAAEHAQQIVDAAEEEEVAKAIEEVNKAVEGEDYEYKDEQNVESPMAVVAPTWESIPQSTIELVNEGTAETPTPDSIESKVEEENMNIKRNNSHNVTFTGVPVVTSLDDVVKIIDSTIAQNDVVVLETKTEIADNAAAQQPQQEQEQQQDQEQEQQNGHVDVEVIEVVEVHAPQENGHGHQETITISHTNGFDGPNIPAPDPSGALGVNYEPKTVVSFSKDLGSEPNNYPDMVKVMIQNGDATSIDEELKELTKVKFDIKADEQDVQVTPVLRTD